MQDINSDQLSPAGGCENAGLCCRSPSDEHIGDLLRAMIAAEPSVNSEATSRAASEVCASASATTVKHSSCKPAATSGSLVPPC